VQLRVALGAAQRPLHYLAILPSMFETVTEGLARAGCTNNARVVLEKPFGRDLASAQHLNRTLLGTKVKKAGESLIGERIELVERNYVPSTPPLPIPGTDAGLKSSSEVNAHTMREMSPRVQRQTKMLRIAQATSRDRQTGSAGQARR
jgi:hypothetical protein